MGIIFATVHVQTRHLVSVQRHASPRDVSKGHLLIPPPHLLDFFFPFSFFFAGQRRFEHARRSRWDCIAVFFFFFYCFLHYFLWKQEGSRHKKMRADPDAYSDVKPRREWRNQGLIWSECPQAQTIWQPESDGFTKTIIHHFSPVSNQLAGLLWAAAPLHTVWHIDG